MCRVTKTYSAHAIQHLTCTICTTISHCIQVNTLAQTQRVQRQQQQQQSLRKAAHGGAGVKSSSVQRDQSQQLRQLGYDTKSLPLYTCCGVRARTAYIGVYASATSNRYTSSCYKCYRYSLPLQVDSYTFDF
jgi:hypothetical protein